MALRKGTAIEEVYPTLYGPDNQPVVPITPPRDPSDGARTRQPGEPFPVGQPNGAPARQLIPPQSVNLTFAPRKWQGYQLISFEQLRGLANWDLVASCITDIVGQVTGMAWSIGVREQWKESESSLQDEINSARLWCELPDPEEDLDWLAWTTKLIDETLVTDAVTIMPRVDRLDRPLGMWLIDGGSIKLLVDELGRRPSPDNPAPFDLAYQQIVDGLPETGFLANQMWYMPRRATTDCPYGRPPTEKVLYTILTSMKEQMSDLMYLRYGNTPDALASVPEGWDATKIREGQDYFDSQMAEGSRKAGIHWVPATMNYTPTRTREWKIDVKEYAARVICHAFQVSPLPLVKVMNRATAEEMESSFTESGIKPIALFVKRVYDRFIQRFLGYPMLEFLWGSDETEDPAVVHARNQAYVGLGAITRNKVREELGEDPIDHPAFQLPTITLPDGRLMLVTDALISKEEFSASNPSGGGGDGSGGGGLLSLGDTPIDLIKVELDKWQRRALSDIKKGVDPGRPFNSEIVPAIVHFEVSSWLDGASSAEEVRRAFSGPLVRKVRSDQNRLRVNGTSNERYKQSSNDSSIVPLNKDSSREKSYSIPHGRKQRR